MPLFRRRRDDLGSLLEQRAQLAEELEQVDADAAWAAASDDRLELNDARDLGRQADALRRSLRDLDARIEAARAALRPPI
ncbi:MAG TPA: hypothetical protein VM345_10490 [Acidimicrobiales bacterium]|nr:hypothetical protein [Acidimicrobiales bacterium]